jgi:hypothetical protein
MDLERAATLVGNGLKAIFVGMTHDGRPFSYWLRSMDGVPDPAVIAKVVARHKALLLAGKEIQGKAKDGFRPCRLTLEPENGSPTLIEELDSVLFASFVFDRDILLGLARAQVRIGLESIRGSMREFVAQGAGGARPEAPGAAPVARQGANLDARIRRVLDRFREGSADGPAGFSRLAMQARVPIQELTEAPEALDDEAQTRVEQKACLLMGVTYPMRL